MAEPKIIDHKIQQADGSVLTIQGPEDASDEELITAATQHLSSKKKSDASSLMSDVIEQAKDIDPMTYGLGAAALTGGALLGSKLKDRFFGNKEAPTRIEPQMDVSTGGPREPYLEPEKPPPPLAGPKTWEDTLSAQDKELLERSRANAAAKTQTAPAPATTPEPPAFIRNQPAVEPLAGAVAPPVVAPAAPAAPERIVSGVKMTEPQYQYYINESTSGISPAQAVEEFNAKNAPLPAPVSDMPKALESTDKLLQKLDEKYGPLPTETSTAALATAEPPKEKPAKKTGRPAASTLEPTTFRPDLGPGDNWLYNTAGPERRKLILKEFNNGKPAKDEKTAYKLYRQYKEKYPKDMFGPVIPLEVAKSRGIPPPENYGKLGKVAKVGGVAGLALTVADLANAAQQSKKGNDAPLLETIFNLIGMIPGVGTAFTAGTYAGGLNEGEMEDLARRRQMPPEITRR